MPAKNWTARVIVSGERDERRRLRAERSGAAPAGARSTRRATSRATPIATSSARRSSTERKGSLLQPRRRPPASCAGRPRTRPISTTRRMPLDHAAEQRRGLPVHAGSPRRRRPRRAKLTDAATLRWQGGAFLFTQNYQQDAVNTFAPFVFSPQVGVPVNQYSPRRRARRLRPRRLRPGHGHAQRQARRHRRPALRLREQERGPQDVLRSGARRRPASSSPKTSFSHVSPQVVGGVPRSIRTRTVYGTVSRRLQGRRLQPGVAGGQREPTARRTSWNFEGGYKTLG